MAQIPPILKTHHRNRYRKYFIFVVGVFVLIVCGILFIFVRVWDGMIIILIILNIHIINNGYRITQPQPH